MITRFCYCIFGFLCLSWCVAVQSETGSSEGSSWIVDREVDPILDTDNVTARLREIGVKRSLFKDGKYLLIRCREKDLDAIVVWGSYGVLGIPFLGDRDLKVVVRFGAGEPKTEIWLPSSDYNASFSPQPDLFLRSLRQHQRLAVRTRSRDGASLTAVFDLSEAAPVVEEVVAACGE